MDISKEVLKKLEFDKVLAELEKYAGSNLAKEKIRELTPTAEINDIKVFQEETSEARDVLRLHPSFTIGAVRDIKNTLRKVKMGATLEPTEFLAISDNIRTSGRIKKFFKNNKEEWKHLKRLVDILEFPKELLKEIDSKITEEGEVRDEASLRLRDIKNSIVSINGKIKTTLNRMISSPEMQKKLQDNIITIRGDRYVIPIKQEYRGQIKGLIHDQSSSGATLFIEPLAVVELNNKLRTLKNEERDEIKRILQELTHYTAQFLDSLESTLEILVELDFIFAKALFSIDFDCIEPDLNTEGDFIIKKARHPLIEKTKVVPITFKFSENINTVIITGPNTGGKTVTLKTIGLMCLMAQSGLHIPADTGSKINIFKKVFVDIGDEQSIEQSLSTFSSHMTNIIKIVEKVDGESLILLDELGAGTDPTEGAALAVALLSYFHEKNAYTVATTHYGQLKNFAYNTPGIQNASVEFDTETLKPTYRLLMGLPGKSNALEISLRLGLKNEIVEKAKEFMGAEELKTADLIQKLEEERQSAEKERNEILEIKKEVERLKEELENEKVKFENRKKEMIAEAAREARKIIKNAEQESKEIIKKLQENKETAALKNRLKEIDKELQSKVNVEKKHLGKAPKKVKPGDIVEVPKLKGTGQILSHADEDGNVLVQMGIMKVNLNIKDLRIPENKIEKEVEKRNIVNLVAQKSKNISLELDLRGNTVEEAIEKIDKYLDDVAIAGLPKATIIHGKGTGALRAGVRDYLKNHPHVKTFRYGSFSEGGNGVTIVEIK